MHCVYRRRDSARLCTQLAAQQAARETDLVVGNYATWLAVGRYTPDALGTFDTLWADEAHSCLEWLTDACTLEFTSRELHTLTLDTPPVGDDSTALATWAMVAVEVARDAYRVARDSHASQETLAALTDVGKRLRELCDACVSDDAQWVCERDRDVYKALPVWPARFAEAKLWRGIERIVLSSATLTHEDAKHLGLSRANDEYSFHELDVASTQRVDRCTTCRPHVSTKTPATASGA